MMALILLMDFGLVEKTAAWCGLLQASGQAICGTESASQAFIWMRSAFFEKWYQLRKEIHWK